MYNNILTTGQDWKWKLIITKLLFHLESKNLLNFKHDKANPIV